MPTFRCRTVVAALLSLSLLLNLFLPASQAQTPTHTPTPPAAIDLTLLKKALAPLASTGPLRSHSILRMTGSKQGISFTFHEEVNVIARRPGRFRADVKQFAVDGSPQSRLLVVSDGLKVWTYQAATHRYSVKPAKAFHAANDDMTATGLAMGGFFLGDGHDLAHGLQSLTPDNNAQVLTALSNMGIDISRHAESFDGEDDFVYRLVLGKQGTTYRFIVNPVTGVLRRLELTGTQNGVTMAFLETIASLSIPAVTSSTFSFTPPRGAAKLSALSVSPF